MEQIYSEATLRTAKAEVDRLETRMPMAAGISYRLQGLIDAAGAARAASAPAADSLRSSVDAVLALRFDGAEPHAESRMIACLLEVGMSRATVGDTPRQSRNSGVNTQVKQTSARRRWTRRTARRCATRSRARSTAARRVRTCTSWRRRPTRLRRWAAARARSASCASSRACRRPTACRATPRLPFSSARTRSASTSCASPPRHFWTLPPPRTHK